MTTTTVTTVHVSVEMEPHSESLEGVILNRPAPQGGAFLIDTRLPREVWTAMKQAGAWYLSADNLEDFDMFDAPVGWRYSLEALAVLVNTGYPLVIRGETVTDEAALRGMFTDEAKAAYHARIRAEREAEAESLRAEAASRQAEADRKGREYEAWKAEQLTGLVETFAGPLVRAVEWAQVAHFDAGTPGTWPTTGDTWYTATVDGQTVYRVAYGNASFCYAPQAVVDAWVRASWDWRVEDVYHGDEIAAARWVLSRQGKSCIGDDIADRLIELYGAEYFAEIARREEWLLTPSNSIVRKEAEDTAVKYGLRLVVMEPDRKGYRGYKAMQAFRNPSQPKEDVASLWRRPDTGQWYAVSYRGVLWPVENVN